MGTTEMRMAQAQAIAEVYGRARAAAIATNDPGVSAEAEARLAVKGYIKTMKTLDHTMWQWVDEAKL